MSMEGRMTLCNMTIEAGARAGMVAPDETTFEYLRDRPFLLKVMILKRQFHFGNSCQVTKMLNLILL